MARTLRLAEQRREWLLREDGQLSLRERRAYRTLWALWNIAWPVLAILAVALAYRTCAYFYDYAQEQSAFGRDPAISREQGHIRVAFAPCLLRHPDDVLGFELGTGTYGSERLARGYFYASRPADIRRHRARGDVYLGRLPGNRLDIDLREITGGREREVTGLTLYCHCPLHALGFFHTYQFRDNASHPTRFF